MIFVTRWPVRIAWCVRALRCAPQRGRTEELFAHETPHLRSRSMDDKGPPAADRCARGNVPRRASPNYRATRTGTSTRARDCRDTCARPDPTSSDDGYSAVATATEGLNLVELTALARRCQQTIRLGAGVQSAIRRRTVTRRGRGLRPQPADPPPRRRYLRVATTARAEHHGWRRRDQGRFSDPSRAVALATGP